MLPRQGWSFNKAMEKSGSPYLDVVSTPVLEGSLAGPQVALTNLFRQVEVRDIPWVASRHHVH